MKTPLILIAFLFSCMMVFAQSDNCNTATWISSSTSCNPTNGSVAGATQSVGANQCAGCNCTSPDDYDVYYRFTAVSTEHTVTLSNLAFNFDAVIELRSSCSSGGNIECYDPSGAVNPISRTFSNLTVGNTYYIRIFEYNYSGTPPISSSFSICVTHSFSTPAPSNDDCNDAQLLTSSTSCSYTSATVDGATPSLGANQCTGCNCTSPDDYDVYFRFTAVATSHTVKIANYSNNFDGVIELREGCGFNQQISCYDPTGAPDPMEQTFNNLQVGQTYYIRVFEYNYTGSQPNSGDFDICVTHSNIVTPPSNDDCNDAQLLTSSTSCSYTSATVDGATPSLGANQCTGCNCTSPDDYDVYFRFTAVATSHTVKIANYSNNFDGVIELREGCGFNQQVSCYDPTGAPDPMEQTFTNLQIGQTYYIRVFEYNYSGSPPNSGDFDICVTHGVIFPQNDDCTNAQTLVSNTTYVYTPSSVAGATPSLGPNQCTGCNCVSPDDYDVYFQFTAVSTEHTVSIANFANNFDGVIELRQGCGFNQQISCYDPIGAPDPMEETYSNLTIGQTYYIRVYEYNYSGSPPSSDNFEISVTHGTTQIPTPVITGNNQICSGQSTTLSVSNPCGGCTYQWSNGQSGTSITVNAPASYTVTASNANGTAVSNPFVVSSSPGPNVTISPVNPSFCTNGNVQLTASGANTYLWSNGQSGSTITVNTPGTYTVTGTDANGCSDPESVTVTQSNSLAVTISANQTLINPGQSTTLSVSPSGAGYTYSWGQAGVNGSSPTVSPQTTTTYNVTVTDNNGCSGTASISIAVQSNPNCNSSTISLSSNQQSFSSVGGNGSFNVTFSSGGNNCAWSVALNDCNWLATNTLSPIGAQFQGASVTFDVPPNNGPARTCTLKIVGGSSVQDFIINQAGVNCTLAQPTITSSGVPNLAASSHQNVSYQWYNFGAPIAGATTQFYTIPSGQTGCYTVRIYDINDNTCYSESNPFCNGSAVGIKDVYEKLDGLRIYPNPNSGRFTVDLNEVNRELVELQVINLIGQVVRSIPLNQQKIIPLDLQNQANGIYFILFRDSQENSFSEKVVIAK